MATRAKKKGWLITGLFIAVVAAISAYNADKVKTWVRKVPMVDDLLTKK